MNILLCRFFVIDCMVLLYMWCTDDMSTVGFDILSGYKLGPCLNHLLCVTWWHNVSSLLSFQYLHWLISILVDAKPECICKNGYVIGAFFLPVSAFYGSSRRGYSVIRLLLLRDLWPFREHCQVKCLNLLIYQLDRISGNMQLVVMYIKLAHTDI